MKSSTRILTILSLLLLLDQTGFCQEDSNGTGKVTYQVSALKFGSRDKRVALRDVAIGAKSTDSVQVVFMFWLLRGSNGRTILVDAGFAEDTARKAITFTRPDTVLMHAGVKPGDVSDIIITHPHWDHIGGIVYFPDARVWMQSADYGYFVGGAWQQGGNSTAFEGQDVINIVVRNLEGKLSLINGDGVEILPGIKVYTGSKHTYESQFVWVRTKSDPVIIASDNAWYYFNVEHSLPIPVTMDAKAYRRNLGRMRKMVSNSDLIIPGHDPEVLLRFPKVADGIVRIRE